MMLNSDTCDGLYALM